MHFPMVIPWIVYNELTVLVCVLQLQSNKVHIDKVPCSQGENVPQQWYIFYITNLYLHHLNPCKREEIIFVLSDIRLFATRRVLLSSPPTENGGDQRRWAPPSPPLTEVRGPPPPLYPRLRDPHFPPFEALTEPRAVATVALCKPVMPRCFLPWQHHVSSKDDFITLYVNVDRFSPKLSQLTPLSGLYPSFFPYSMESDVSLADCVHRVWCLELEKGGHSDPLPR